MMRLLGRTDKKSSAWIDLYSNVQDNLHRSGDHLLLIFDLDCVMESQDFDDMESLFEGMVLFTPPRVVDNNCTDVSNDEVPMLNNGDATVASTSSSSSHPLDENLFSDLTVITASKSESAHTEAVETSSMWTENKEKLTPSISRQISRRKKRASLKIGYGRDVQVFDDHPSISLTTTHIALQADNVAHGEAKEDSTSTYYGSQSKQVNSHVSPSDTCEPVDFRLNGTILNVQTSENSGLKVAPDSNVVSFSAEVSEKRHWQNHGKEDENKTCKPVEDQYEQIKQIISQKLKDVRELVSSNSEARKKSKSSRRKASERVDLASARYRELEKRLEEACETEDFDTAEHLSQSLAAAEVENARLLHSLRESEAECRAIDLEMQQSVKHQIAVEEECASLLQYFSTDAERVADLVLKNTEVNSERELDDWFSSIEALEVNKIQVEIESLLVNEARSTLNDSVMHLVEIDVREKEKLLTKKKLLTEELERLLSLMQAKEAEITENDSKIDLIDKRIADVFFGFEEKQSGIESEFLKLQSSLSQMAAEQETLFKKKSEVDEHLFKEKDRGSKLRLLAAASNEEAKALKENIGLRRSLLLSVLKSSGEKERLTRTEEKIMTDIEILRLKVSSARASIQELTSKKSSIQQEIAAMKQKMFFIDKRIPELEADKKAAAAARNFKEAARIAAEAKMLSTDKETQHKKMEEATLELRKLEEQIERTSREVQETEGFVLMKEKEVAVARCQNLCLIARAAAGERSAAVLLGDTEEANKLLFEADCAESEAKQLQSLHNISQEELEIPLACFVPMELVSTLDGEQLAELVASVDYFSAS